MKSAEGQAIEFCTFGIFVLDEIHFQPPKAPVLDVTGGAGTFAALGARMLSPPPQAKAVGWIVDAGNDFPVELRSLIESWETSCKIRDTPDRLTTRAWNGYGDNEARAFKFTTPKLRLVPASLDEKLLLSKSFHMACSPTRCIDIITGTLRRREGLTRERPIFLWEPIPDFCMPEELQNCYEAMKLVDVVSPNHAELMSFFGKDAHNKDGSLDVHSLHTCVDEWVGYANREKLDLTVVVRAGKHGCYYAKDDQSGWVPAYHQEQSRVVDPTGGGNAFLGGFAVGYIRMRDRPKWDRLIEACVMGSVAASYAIEQIGIPRLEKHGWTDESWNGTRVDDRLESLRQRCGPP